ncbi:Uncharacterised protein [Vibrio cholerae]|uniref:Uncharacterized protein n=1 Tax=Vibrio cholerae TaxID=666 RepID=A0A656AM49_VIBCL|nr:Uncharacterised protein [Vibrio cholerae]
MRIQTRGCGKCRNRHAPTLAKTRLIIIGFMALLGRVGTNLPLFGVFAPFVKDGHIKKSLGVLHTA